MIARALIEALTIAGGVVIFLAASLLLGVVGHVALTMWRAHRTSALSCAAMGCTAPVVATYSLRYTDGRPGPTAESCWEHAPGVHRVLGMLGRSMDAEVETTVMEKSR